MNTKNGCVAQSNHSKAGDSSEHFILVKRCNNIISLTVNERRLRISNSKYDMESMFLMGPTGEVLIERHFRATSRRCSRNVVCDFYWKQVSSQSTIDVQDIPPVLVAPVNNRIGSSPVYVISIQKDNIFYLVACLGEVPPLLVIEFLHRVASIFTEYFGSPCDENAIKDNFSTVYQLLEEMVDNGWPLTTEPNSLKSMIRPPTLVGKLEKVVMGTQSNAAVSESLPDGTISNMPWRKAGVKYAHNEIYVDIFEEVDAIVDINGRVISSDVSGSIMVQSHLSGVPDLLLSFKDPAVIDDCAFHPCVRYNRYERDQVISFVPPDGDFELMRYRVKNASQLISLPITCRPQFNYSSPSPTLSVVIGMKAVTSLIKSSGGSIGVIEEVSVTIPFPKSVRTTDLRVSFGRVLYDESTKIAKWTIGKLDDKTRQYDLKGSITLTKGSLRPEENPPLQLTWKIPLASVSGLSVSGLNLSGESYRPYKGVRNIVKSGKYQVRCN